MTEKRDRETRIDPTMVEDVPPQALEDESASTREVYEKLVKPANPKLAKAVTAAAKRVAELKKQKKK